MPIAVFIRKQNRGKFGNTSSISTTHLAVHADHLNTPRRLSNAQGQVEWQWAYSAFGQTPALDRSSYFGAVFKVGNTFPQVEYNLRYPGQQYDAE